MKKIQVPTSYLPFQKKQAAGVGGSPEINAIYNISSGTFPEMLGSVCLTHLKTCYK